MASVPQLRFQVLDLPAEGMDFEVTVSFSALELDESDLLSFASPLHVSLNLSPVGEGVLVRGSAWAEVMRLCDRCLKAERVRVQAPDLCYHVEEVEGNFLDLTDAVREDIVLALPQHYLCSEDCAGLCPHCGQDLNEGPCSCPEEAGDTDPWQALDGLDVGSEDE